MPLTAIRTFRFTHRSLDPDGTVRLGYALDELEFEESFSLPRPTVLPDSARPLLDLLHWTAGVSYYKAAIPRGIEFAQRTPPPATLALLDALYRDGLGEFAVVNQLDGLPDPQFQAACGQLDAPAVLATAHVSAPRRVLVPVGGGKDSAVAIEVTRRSGATVELFSLGDAAPIRACAQVAALPRHVVWRRIDPALFELNANGALNGHIPITAIISAVALLVAATQGLDAVALANERSASAGNLVWHGVEVNHQFSKSLRAERLIRAATAEIPGAPLIFSLLRPASELSIARAFAGLDAYHRAFTSCNRVFRLDDDRRASSWCCDCDKCRFVYLILAPFLDPPALAAIFGADLLADQRQYAGFARLAAGDDKPFECVGEAVECRAAMQLLARQPHWSAHAVVRRLAAEVLGDDMVVGDVELRGLFSLADDHYVPDGLIGALGEVLGA